MFFRRPGDKPLSEPMMASLLTHIYVIRPQRVNHSKVLLSDNMDYMIITIYNFQNPIRIIIAVSLHRPRYQYSFIYQIPYYYMSIQCFNRPLFSFFRDDWHMKDIRFCSKHIERYNLQPNRSENTYFHFFFNNHRIEAN